MADERSNMKKWREQRIVAACLAGVSVLIAPGCGGSGGQTSGQSGPVSSDVVQSTPTTQDVTLKGKTFKLELALDDDAREQGLSDRKEIAEDGGMLFVLESSRRARFVMRRCYVPIDLIYMDDQGYIDSMYQMQVIEPVGGPEWKNPSRSYTSAGAVRFVIELKGGTLDKLGLRLGERIDLPSEKLISWAQ